MLADAAERRLAVYDPVAGVGPTKVVSEAVRIGEVREASLEDECPAEYASIRIARCFMLVIFSNSCMTSWRLRTTGSLRGFLANGMCLTTQSLPSVVR